MIHPCQILEFTGMELVGRKNDSDQTESSSKEDDSNWTEETQRLLLRMTALKQDLPPPPKRYIYKLRSLLIASETIYVDMLYVIMQTIQILTMP